MDFKAILAFITKLTPRERIIFYVTIGVVGLVLLDRMILSPILNKISYLNASIDEKEDMIEQSLLIVNQEKRIEEETSQYAPFLSEPQPEEKTITEFLQEVENLAKKSSIYLTDIKPSSREAEGDVVHHYVRLNFEAQMEQVFNFFYNVSNNEKLIKIENYQIRPKTEGSSIIVCNASISKAIVPE